MEREIKIEILMCDRCTKAEAEKHLEKGTTIFEDFEENFNEYMQEWGIDEESQELYRQMIDDKIPVEDWGIVEKDNKTYYIMYVL